MSNAPLNGVREARASYQPGASARAPGPFRFTFDDLLKMRDAGVFQEGEHIELVDGEFVLMPSEGTTHQYAVRVMNQWLAELLFTRPGLKARYALYAHGTLLFDPGNRREPDLMIAAPVDSHTSVTPADVAFLFEAANTSAPTDLGAKRVQYASANIAEYWVWETQAARLSVFRRPQDGDYGFKETFTPGQTIAPLFAPEALFDYAQLTG